MKILGMGVPELLVILVIILLIFGPKNLPKLGSALGRTVKNLREGMNSGKDAEATSAEDDDDIEEIDEVDVDEEAEAARKKAAAKKAAAKKAAAKKSE